MVDEPHPTVAALLTGERTGPGVWQENYWYRRHEVVYNWMRDRRCHGRVLDAGCGEGYGAQLLGTTAETVVAVDYDATVTSHVRATYPRLAVLRGNLVQLPLAEDTVAAVVCLQTIEHLWDQRAFVAECARVCAPGGIVVISTPNRLTFPPGHFCHARELDARELRQLLEPELRIARLLGVGHATRLREWERRHGSLPHAQVATEPDAWPRELADVVASVTTDDFELHDVDDGSGPERDPDTTLDLVAVAESADALTPASGSRTPTGG